MSDEIDETEEAPKKLPLIGIISMVLALLILLIAVPASYSVYQKSRNAPPSPERVLYERLRGDVADYQKASRLLESQRRLRTGYENTNRPTEDLDRIAASACSTANALAIDYNTVMAQNGHPFTGEKPLPEDLPGARPLPQSLDPVGC